ncbi:MAG: GGDEF domain-containing protein [Atopobiaceae bacterium]|jgi:diguanylate cyclase (GGDEF)-like protein|nr:GGDEF domain-containing protein [Atopobiaceae bacterium]MCH4214622.1 GGDEF domain-containing protein [Atopobiaceae bacterium]MCH4230503.1 GGDEF domain-containing protein [Atopobiaceae bacterium]MCH4275783.1 GGDEF domain-containing protein [Atopobiaceae bacterium]MCI1225853.1 GGDEF domain-containing protein [Atopobiaceae bacterium]
MSIQEILTSNFVTLSLIVGLGAITISNRTFDKSTTRHFIWFIVIVLVLDVSDMADCALSYLPAPTGWRYLTSAIGYTLRPASVAIVISIFLRRRRLGLALWIPVIMVGIIAFSSYSTHLMYWFDDHNAFEQGYLWALPYVVSSAYMALLIYLSVRLHSAVGSAEVFIVVYVTFICFLATILERQTSARFLLDGAIIVSCALYYLFLYVQIYQRDILTGLPNRRSFYIDAGKTAGERKVIISSDLNGLKLINDTKGHQAGDEALKALARSITSQQGKAYTTYRTGGDEFMTIGRGKTVEEADALVDQIRATLTDEGIMASFGCAPYSPGDSLDDVCNEADGHMYEDKRHYRGTTRG